METSRKLIIEGKDTPYRVYRDGRLWSSLRGGGFMRPHTNGSGYAIYNTSGTLGRAYLAHTLVSLAFGGYCRGIKMGGGVVGGRCKGVRCFNDNEEMFFDSVGAFCEHFSVYRKKFNRIVGSGKKIDGWFVVYLDGRDAPWSKTVKKGGF